MTPHARRIQAVIRCRHALIAGDIFARLMIKLGVRIRFESLS